MGKLLVLPLLKVDHDEEVWDNPLPNKGHRLVGRFGEALHDDIVLTVQSGHMFVKDVHHNIVRHVEHVLDVGIDFLADFGLLADLLLE